jgi:hypothetical protein
VASGIYTNAKKLFLAAGLDLSANTIKCLLVTSSYTPNLDTHTSRADITNEVTGTGYTAGGIALTTKTVTADNTNHLGKFTADPVVWATSTITARRAILYRSNGGASSGDPLICEFDFVSDVVSTAGNFTITWAAGGIIQLT